jgi:hypothetical protein
LKIPVRGFHIKDLNTTSKLQIYKTIIQPIVTYGCETWAKTVTEQNRPRLFERRVLRKIFGPTLDKDGTWRIKTNEERENLINPLNAEVNPICHLLALLGAHPILHVSRIRVKKKNIVRFIKSQRLRWVAHVIRMDTTRTVKKLTEWEPCSSRPIGRPRLRWLNQVEEDLKKIKVQNWREKCKDRRLWNEIIKQAKTHPVL